MDAPREGKRQIVVILVAGLGAVGSAVVHHLARAGETVVGVDPWLPPHARGSTGGRSRIHRRAYMEGALYLPLLNRAEALWSELEALSGRPLLHRTGALMIGPPEGRLLKESLGTARSEGIPVEPLDHDTLRTRFPHLSPPAGAEGLLEPGAGFLDPEACVVSHLDAARAAGASIRTGEGVLGWSSDGEGLRVRTNRGEITVDRLVLAVGPWLGGMRVPGLPLHPQVERQVSGRFVLREGSGAPDLPVLLMDRGDEPLMYVIPEGDGVLKAGLHHGGDMAHDPAGIRREVLQDDEVRISAPLGSLIPHLQPRWLDGSVCLYTNLPDGHWRMGPLPGDPRVVVVSACSGHGFKASSAVGEGVAALARGVEPPVDLSPFALHGE